MTAEDLKKSILQEAIQGKLVPQIASEGTGKELLDKILKEKAELIKEGKIKKEKPLEPIKEDEIPFDIPESWCWCRLGEIVNILGGKRIPAGKHLTETPTEHKYIRVADMKKGTVLLENIKYVPDDIYPIIKNYTISKDDIYITVAGTLGDVGIIPEELDGANLTENADKLINYSHLLNKKHLLYVLSSPFFKKQVLSSKTQVGQPKLAIKRIQNFFIPLPPLAEQQRIVDAIEKFISLVEEYGNREIKLNSLNNVIGEKTKKAVLQEAISGALTEGWRKNNKVSETGKDLLDKILKEKAELIKEKKLKKEKPLEPIKEEEIPFDIPESWCWCRLGEITFNNGQKKPDKKFSYIDIGSINNEKQILNDNEKLLAPESAPSRARKIVKIGDILYSTVRPYLHNMCMVDRKFTCEPIASTGFAVISCGGHLYNKYLFYYLLSPEFDSYANDIKNSKGVAYPAINDNRLFNGLVPLPPLEEQKQIVKTIEALLPLCEKLGK